MNTYILLLFHVCDVINWGNCCTDIPLRCTEHLSVSVMSLPLFSSIVSRAIKKFFSYNAMKERIWFCHKLGQQYWHCHDMLLVFSITSTICLTLSLYVLLYFYIDYCIDYYIDKYCSFSTINFKKMLLWTSDFFAENSIHKNNKYL